MFSFAFNLSCLIFLSLIGTFYLLKKKIPNVENQVYKRILCTSFLGLLIDVLGYILFKIDMNYSSILNIIIAKIYLLYFLLWITFFKDYMVAVNTRNEKKLHNSQIISLIIIIIFIMLDISIPINIIDNGGLIYSEGLSVIILYLIVGIHVLYMIYLLIKYAKHTKLSEKLPLYVFIILGTIR